MNKFIIGSMMALHLLFTSCSKERNEPANPQQTQAKDITYIELGVGSDQGNDARALIYNQRTDNTKVPRLKIFWGNDGDKVKVFTVISTEERSRGMFKVIYKGPLEWVAQNNGTRLVYKGKIGVPTADIEGKNMLYISALPYKEGGDNEFRKSDGFVALDGSGQTNPADLDIYTMMETNLKRVEVNSNRFVNANDQIQYPSVFRTYGHFVTVTIHNNLSTPITPKRAKYDFITSSNNPMLFSVRTSFIDEAYDLLALFSYEEGEQVHNGPFRLARNKLRDTPYHYESFPEQSIAPGTTKHYIMWFPNYYELGEMETKLSFEFMETEAQQAIVVTGIPPINLLSNSTTLPSPAQNCPYVLTVG